MIGTGFNAPAVMNPAGPGNPLLDKMLSKYHKL